MFSEDRFSYWVTSGVPVVSAAVVRTTGRFLDGGRADVRQHRKRDAVLLAEHCEGLNGVVTDGC
jgi:hypothetical protein